MPYRAWGQTLISDYSALTRAWGQTLISDYSALTIRQGIRSYPLADHSIHVKFDKMLEKRIGKNKSSLRLKNPTVCKQN